jgi:hypothetical protein
MKTVSRLAIVLVALVLGLSIGKADDKTKDFGVAVYKMGEERATDKDAGPNFDTFLAYLEKKLEGARFPRRGIRNNADDAKKVMEDAKKPTAMGIVSPNFYFRHKDALKLTVIAEAQRKGLNGEQYVLIGASKADKYPEGKKVATNLDDADWLNKVVMPTPEGVNPIQWVKSKNIFDDLLDIAYEDSEVDFVLVDRITLALAEDNKEIKGLARGLKSEMLPQDLVVEVDGRLGDRREAIQKALKGLDGDDEGKKVGEGIQVPKFMDVDEARLKAAGERFSKGAK